MAVTVKKPAVRVVAPRRPLGPTHMRPIAWSAAHPEAPPYRPIT